MGISLIIITLGFIWYFYRIYKEEKANKQLNEIYQRRIAKAERTRRLINERPDNVVFQSDLTISDRTFTYVGNMNELKRYNLKEGAIARKDNTFYLYNEGKWVEIIDDMPNIGFLKH